MTFNTVNISTKFEISLAFHWEVVAHFVRQLRDLVTFTSNVKPYFAYNLHIILRHFEAFCSWVKI